MRWLRRLERSRLWCRLGVHQRDLAILTWSGPDGAGSAQRLTCRRCLTPL